MRRGVSEVVGFVLTIAIIVTATVTAYMWASGVTAGMSDPGKIKNFANQMVSLDYIVRGTAHGDFNFTNSFEMYVPGGAVSLREGSDSIALEFNQQALVIGYTNATAASSCSYDSDYFYDNVSGITLFRISHGSLTYQGANGAGAGPAQVSICYPDIDLVWAGNCIRGKSGPFITVQAKKIGLDGSKPVVAIDIC